MQIKSYFKSLNKKGKAVPVITGYFSEISKFMYELNRNLHLSVFLTARF